MSHPKITREMRAMAHAILDDEFEAAVALRDAIEECKQGIPISPVKTIRDINNLRAVVFIEEGLDVNSNDLINLEKRVEDWLRIGGVNPLIVFGVSRIELYEIEDKSKQEEFHIGRVIDASPNMTDNGDGEGKIDEKEAEKFIDIKKDMRHHETHACYRG